LKHIRPGLVLFLIVDFLIAAAIIIAVINKG
jgi:hypothetical protein